MADRDQRRLEVGLAHEGVPLESAAREDGGVSGVDGKLSGAQLDRAATDPSVVADEQARRPGFEKDVSHASFDVLAQDAPELAAARASGLTPGEAVADSIRAGEPRPGRELARALGWGEGQRRTAEALDPGRDAVQAVEVGGEHRGIRLPEAERLQMCECGRAVDVPDEPARVAAVAPGRVRLLDHRDVRAAVGGRDRRGGPCRAESDHEHVGLEVSHRRTGRSQIRRARSATRRTGRRGRIAAAAPAGGRSSRRRGTGLAAA